MGKIMKHAESEDTSKQAGPRRPSADRPGAHWALRLAPREGGRKLALRPSRAALGLIGLLGALGLAMIAVVFVPLVLVPMKVVAVVLGLVFLTSAVLPMLRPARCEFDKTDGVLRFGTGPRKNDRTIPLGDILAVRAAHGAVQPNPDIKPREVFELHLLLEDGRRLTLARHTSDAWIAPAAEQLAEFLDVPLARNSDGEPADPEGEDRP